MKTNNMTKRKVAEAEIRERLECLQETLTERNRRLFAGSEALAFGYGSITAASRATGLSPKTVRRGFEECREIELGVVPPLALHRSRHPGGGRKKLTQKHPRLLSTLQELVESNTLADSRGPGLESKSNKSVSFGL